MADYQERFRLQYIDIKTNENKRSPPGDVSFRLHYIDIKTRIFKYIFYFLIQFV